MSETTETLKNEQVSVQLTKKPHCKIEQEVEATPALVSAAKKKALKEVGKSVSIPGFRKGKAPAKTIEQKYPAQVEGSWKQEIADLAFRASLELTNIPLLNNNAQVSFNMISFSDEGAKMTFSYETEPVVPEVDASGFHLKEIERPEVSEKHITEAVRQMQMFYAQWTEVTDRAVEEGDFVILDVDTIEDEPKKVFNGTRFEVTEKSMANWMRSLVLGKKSKDVLEGVSEPDDHLSEKEKKEYEPKKVRVTIKKIETAKVPDINDDFARGMGSPSVEEMNKSIEKMLNDRADEKVNLEKKEQINAFLLKNFPVELPMTLIESEKEHRRKQMMQDPNYKNRYDQMTEEEKQEAEKTLTEQATDAVSLFYLARKVVQDAKLNIGPQDIQTEVQNMLKDVGGAASQEIPKELYALALSRIMLAKAQQHLMKENA